MKVATIITHTQIIYYRYIPLNRVQNPKGKCPIIYLKEFLSKQGYIEIPIGQCLTTQEKQYRLFI